MFGEAGMLRLYLRHLKVVRYSRLHEFNAFKCRWPLEAIESADPYSNCNSGQLLGLHRMPHEFHIRSEKRFDNRFNRLNAWYDWHRPSQGDEVLEDQPIYSPFVTDITRPNAVKPGPAISKRRIAVD
ncbi:hypothetical protein BPAE_0016g00160 [Botrytis paeoniae]|uniref:Uncharacterized protein n=1 Tax=Botrytis paeoniae TaxID=278948 RepID=A0A4Z1FWT8_9HELO|nr:hypothetical protein BPAE_0016g00160 [Botrytis paeoniae]